MGRTLVVLAFTVAALVAVYKCVVRPPEKDEPVGPVSSETVQTGTETQPVDLSTVRKDNYFTILVYGVDDGNGGSDTNILVGFDAATGQANCVSIPRDTAMYINGKSHKFNYAYNDGGQTLLCSSLSDMLGIPVDYYVEVNLKGFVELVDAIGGVDFDIPINMNYDDPYQDLEIHFKKGLQHLTGEEAIKVVRFRHNNDGSGYGTEDLGRIGTQQAFLKTVAQQMLQPSNLSKVSTYAKIFNQYVKTDLNLGNLAWFGQEVIQMGTGNINFYTLPGEWSGAKGRYMLDTAAAVEMVNRCLNPYQQPRALSDMNLVT